MATDLKRKLEATISSFVSDIRELAREAALDAVAGAFAGSAGRSEKHAAATARLRPQPTNGAKRSATELNAAVSQLENYMRQHPGERIEQIARALGLPSRELRLPTKKLLASRRVRTEGQKRATRYFPS